MLKHAPFRRALAVPARPERHSTRSLAPLAPSRPPLQERARRAAARRIQELLDTQN